MKVINLLKHPYRQVNKIIWHFEKQKFKSVGVHCKVGPFFKISGNQYISIGDDFFAGERFSIDVWDEIAKKNRTTLPQLIIKDHVVITDGCYISCAKKITIESGVLFGPNVFVTDNMHGQNKRSELKIPPYKRSIYSKGEVSIGKNVWVGRNACIMPGVTIGEAAIIGANAVVTHDVPPFSIVGGVPAQIIKRM